MSKRTNFRFERIYLNFSLFSLFRILFIIWKQTIRAYSAQTGDFVREFEQAEGRIIGIALHPNFSNTVIGCINTGQLIFWDCHSGLITSNLV